MQIPRTRLTAACNSEPRSHPILDAVTSSRVALNQERYSHLAASDSTAPPKEKHDGLTPIKVRREARGIHESALGRSVKSGIARAMIADDIRHIKIK
jgi:hypothetical protein